MEFHILIYFDEFWLIVDKFWRILTRQNFFKNSTKFEEEIHQFVMLGDELSFVGKLVRARLHGALGLLRLAGPLHDLDEDPEEHVQEHQVRQPGRAHLKESRRYGCKM